MGAIRGSLTYSRFTVDAALARDYRSKFMQALRLRAFEPLSPEDEEEQRTGWCVVDRVFDLELTPEKVFQGSYLTLGFRIDRWRIPSALLKAQLAEQTDKLLAKTGREKLGKRERAELKALVIARLRKKTEPTSKVIDVCWHLDAGVVRVWTHSRKVLEDFAALFEKTFGLVPSFESPYAAAMRAGLDRARVDALKMVQPTPLHGTPRSAKSPRQPAGEGDASERIETTRFLGSEFLVWLWCTSELCNGRLLAHGGAELELWLGKAIEFASPLERTERVTVRGAAPSAAAESRESLRQGKLPMKARLFARVAEREFSWQLLAETLGVSSATLPAVLSRDTDEAFVERMELIQELEKAVYGLYTAFLDLRLGTEWEEQVAPALRAWVKEQRVDTAGYARLLMDAASEHKPSTRRKLRAAR